MESTKKMLLVFLILTFSIGMVEAQKPTSANELISNALSQAKKENKNVFVKFTAFWCRWCKIMDANMKSESCKKYFNDNYVIVTLTANEDNIRKMVAKDSGEAFVSNENPGANELLAKYGSEKAGTSISKFGMPFWYVLDSNGNLIEDAFDENGENISCPSKPELIDEFIKKLQNTSTITEDDILAIREQFIAKE